MPEPPGAPSPAAAEPGRISRRRESVLSFVSEYARAVPEAPDLLLPPLSVTAGGALLAALPFTPQFGLTLVCVGAFMWYSLDGPRLRRRSAAGYRFLCPGCRCFARFGYACRTCRRRLAHDEVPPDALAAAGRGARLPWILGATPLERCGHCSQQLTRNARTGKSGVALQCTLCKGTWDSDVHDGRTVWVLGTLATEDFQHFVRGAADRLVFATRQIVCVDDGSRLIYCLHLPDFAAIGRQRNRGHAAHHVTHLWTTGMASPLALGAELDRYAREYPDAAAHLRALVAREEAACPAAEFLCQRLRSVEFGVGLTRFFGTGEPPSERRTSPPRDRP